jgi:DNA-binding MarR family transcriptional regulator
MTLDQQKIRALAGFRSALRRFLAFSEDAVSEAGVTSLQYQALLVIKAAEGRVALGELTKEMLLKPNAAVQMVDRLSAMGLVERSQARDDRRAVDVSLTEKGDALAVRMVAMHLNQLAKRKKQFADILRQLKQTQTG